MRVFLPEKLSFSPSHLRHLTRPFALKLPFCVNHQETLYTDQDPEAGYSAFFIYPAFPCLPGLAASNICILTG